MHMKIIKATLKDSDIVAKIHSTAWKQAYENVFPVEFIQDDSIAKRKEEFLESWNEKEIDYFIIFDEEPVGMMKIKHCEKICEILSIYLLKQQWNKGFGTQAMRYILKTYSFMEIYLWTLENNVNAQKFYEKLGFSKTGEKRKINRGKEFIQLKYMYRNLD